VSTPTTSITTPLSSTECAAKAREHAANKATWRPHVKHEPQTRHYHRLEHNDAYETYVISWMDDHDTGFHDHDVSCGGVHVIEGGIFEERLGFGTDHLERLVGPGETIEFAPSYIHRFRPKDGIPTVTIHVYSPPLRTMGAYHQGADGALIRTPIDGDEELVNFDA